MNIAIYISRDEVNRHFARQLASSNGIEMVVLDLQDLDRKVLELADFVIYDVDSHAYDLHHVMQNVLVGAQTLQLQFVHSYSLDEMPSLRALGVVCVRNVEELFNGATTPPLRRIVLSKMQCATFKQSSVSLFHNQPRPSLRRGGKKGSGTETIFLQSGLTIVN